MKERQQNLSQHVPKESIKRVRKPFPRQKKLSVSQQISIFPNLANRAKLTQLAPETGDDAPSSNQKTYTAKRTLFPVTFTDAILQPTEHSGQLIGTILDLRNMTMMVTWDTGSGVNIVEHSFLHSLISNPEYIKATEPCGMVGVGLGETYMPYYVSLPIRMLNTENEVVTFECKQVWVCDNYLMDITKPASKTNVPILIGNAFLRNHRLSVDFGYPGSRDYLKYWRGAKDGFWYFPCLSHAESSQT